VIIGSMCVQAPSTASQPVEYEEEDELCVVCWERERDVSFYRCGHTVRPHTSGLAALPLLTASQRSVKADHSFIRSFITRVPIRRSGLAANILWQPSNLPCLGVFSTM